MLIIVNYCHWWWLMLSGHFWLSHWGRQTVSRGSQSWENLGCKGWQPNFTGGTRWETAPDFSNPEAREGNYRGSDLWRKNYHLREIRFVLHLPERQLWPQLWKLQRNVSSAGKTLQHGKHWPHKRTGCPEGWTAYCHWVWTQELWSAKGDQKLP